MELFRQLITIILYIVTFPLRIWNYLRAAIFGPSSKPLTTADREVMRAKLKNAILNRCKVDILKYLGYCIIQAMQQLNQPLTFEELCIILEVESQPDPELTKRAILSLLTIGIKSHIIQKNYCGEYKLTNIMHIFLQGHQVTPYNIALVKKYLRQFEYKNFMDVRTIRRRRRNPMSGDNSDEPEFQDENDSPPNAISGENSDESESDDGNDSQPNAISGENSNEPELEDENDSQSNAISGYESDFEDESDVSDSGSEVDAKSEEIKDEKIEATAQNNGFMNPELNVLRVNNADKSKLSFEYVTAANTSDSKNRPESVQTSTEPSQVITAGANIQHSTLGHIPIAITAPKMQSIDDHHKDQIDDEKCMVALRNRRVKIVVEKMDSNNC